MMTLEELVKTLETQLSSVDVKVRDLTGEGNHFDAVVVSPDFAGMSRIERHRKVLLALSEKFQGPLHAFTFKAYTPEEWEKL